MYELYNSAGYDLYQPFEGVDQWVIDPKSSAAYHGSLKEVVKFMINELGFHMEDVEDSLNFLADNIHQGHNAIHIGMARTSIYTFEKLVNNEKKVG